MREVILKQLDPQATLQEKRNHLRCSLQIVLLKILHESGVSSPLAFTGGLPQRLEDVYQIFRAKGAYLRFKSLLESVGLLDEWHRFEDERTKSALLEWCKDNRLQINE